MYSDIQIFMFFNLLKKALIRPK